MRTPPAVLARGLRKRYGELLAVDGIDVTVPAATCFGFLGPNGAGKTTTMKMIYGEPDLEGVFLAITGHGLGDG